MTPRIKITYQTVTPESAVDGDFADTGWVDEDGVDVSPDEYDTDEGQTVVDNAVRLLRNEGASEPSSTAFHKGVWYSQPDPAMTRAYFERGEHTTQSYHLHGFTVDDERAVFERMRGTR